MKTMYSIEGAGNILVAERVFEAPLSAVWNAWTNVSVLERWWAPAPYKAVTASYSFAENGVWHYYMAGPEGDKHWCLNTYRSIEPEVQFTAEDAFCDENQQINDTLPISMWLVEFKVEGKETRVTVTATYESATALEQIMAMGMKEGFDMGLNQLEVLLTEEK